MRWPLTVSIDKLFFVTSWNSVYECPVDANWRQREARVSVCLNYATPTCPIFYFIDFTEVNKCNYHQIGVLTAVYFGTIRLPPLPLIHSRSGGPITTTRPILEFKMFSLELVELTADDVSASRIFKKFMRWVALPLQSQDEYRTFINNLHGLSKLFVTYYNSFAGNSREDFEVTVFTLQCVQVYPEHKDVSQNIALFQNDIILNWSK